MEEIEEEQKDFLNKVLEHYETVNKSFEEVENEALKLMLENSRQHRDFLKYLITIFFAVISIAVTLSTSEHFHIRNYLIAGVVIYVFNILFSLSHLRETLDSESVSFSKTSFKYKKISLEQRKIAEKYLLSEHVSREEFIKYLNEFNTSRGMVEIAEEYKKLPEDVAKQEKEQLEYLFETTIFLFLGGSLFLGLSLLGWCLSWYYLILVLALLAIISYSDWAIFFSRNIPSRIANYIKRILK